MRCTEGTVLFSAYPCGIKTIGHGAFFKNGFIQSVTVPDGVTKIGELAFAHCKELQLITVPSSVLRIEKDAFNGNAIFTMQCNKGSYASTFAGTKSNIHTEFLSDTQMRSSKKESVSNPAMTNTIADHTDETFNQITNSFGSMKIGQYVKNTMALLVNNNLLNQSTVEELQDKTRCKEIFHISYPLLLKIDLTRPVKDQMKINGQNRYWKEVYTINGEPFIVCSQWYENNRQYFTAWLEKTISAE